MPTLADCLERVYGLKTKRPEAKFIQKQADKYLKEGYSGKDANIGAVKDYLKKLKSERKAITDQVKPAPKAEPIKLTSAEKEPTPEPLKEVTKLDLKLEGEKVGRKEVEGFKKVTEEKLQVKEYDAFKDIEVSVKAKSAKTGKEIGTARVNAKKALEKIDLQIEKLNKFLECLKT